MQHIPCSWEKEYRFQPNIRAAKDDWQTATKATYMYPPRSSSVANKRNDARFVQESSLGMSSHRHPVGLPKDARLRPASAAKPASLHQVADRPPSSQASLYQVHKSGYRPSTTPSNMGGVVAAGRVGSGRSVSVAPSRGGEVGGRPLDVTSANYYTVTAEDGRSVSRIENVPLEGQAREYRSDPLESQERMYKETVRDRRNEHLRSGAVEPEWERQRIVMDLVGAKSADAFIEQGYDPRYRPPGGLIDARRSRRTMSARDRTAMTHSLFPENYKDARPTSVLGGEKVSKKQSRRAIVDEEDKAAAARQGMEDDRMGADGRPYAYHDTVPAYPPYLSRDDRLEHSYSRAHPFGRLPGALHTSLAEVNTSAAHRAGMYDIHGPSSSSQFSAITSRYKRGSDGVSETSFYPHPQGRSLPLSESYIGGDVSVFHGRNGPVFVADAHEGSGYPTASALMTSQPVLSPPRRGAEHATRFGDYEILPSAEELLAKDKESMMRRAAAGYTSPNRLDRTGTPQPYEGDRYDATLPQSYRVLPGKVGPVIVDTSDDITPQITPRPFHDDRDVYVKDTTRESFVRLSPEQVREAQRLLETPSAEDSFANPLWSRMPGAYAVGGVAGAAANTYHNATPSVQSSAYYPPQPSGSTVYPPYGR